jgi:hypothetical protein
VAKKLLALGILISLPTLFAVLAGEGTLAPRAVAVASPAATATRPLAVETAAPTPDPALGGKVAAAEAARAIQNVVRWWPKDDPRRTLAPDRPGRRATT